MSDPEPEPEPTPVTVIGDRPPTFKVEISTPGERKGFYIENIESRANVQVSTGSADAMETTTTAHAQETVAEVPETIASSGKSTCPPPSGDGLDEFMKALADVPAQKIGPFLVLIYLGAFVWLAAELDPAWLVLLTSLSSFVLFPVLKV